MHLNRIRDIFTGIMICKNEIVDRGTVESKSLSGCMIVVSNPVFGMYSGGQL